MDKSQPLSSHRRTGAWAGPIARYLFLAMVICGFMELWESLPVGLPRHDALTPCRQAGERLCQVHHGTAVGYVPCRLMRLRWQHHFTAQR